MAPAPAREDTSAKAVIVHSIDQARAALAAASAAGVPVTLITGCEAGAYLGPLWFRELVDLAAGEYPGVAVDSLLDCGDRAGLVLAALRAGQKRVRFSGSRSAAARLGQIAAAQGASVTARRPAALDLLDQPDPEQACRDWLSSARSR